MRISADLALLDTEREEALEREEEIKHARYEIETLQDQLYSLQVCLSCECGCFYGVSVCGWGCGCGYMYVDVYACVYI